MPEKGIGEGPGLHYYLFAPSWHNYGGEQDRSGKNEVVDGIVAEANAEHVTGASLAS